MNSIIAFFVGKGIDTPFDKQQTLNTKLSGVKTLANIPFVVTDTADGSTADRLMTDKQLRKSNLTSYDIDELSTRNLKSVKASILKPMWANGQSAKSVAEHYKRLKKKGFSVRLIENYFAAFAKALTTTLLDE